MKRSNYSKLKNIAIISLVLLNVACVWIIFNRHPYQRGNRGSEKRQMMSEKALEREVGLDKSQLMEFYTLRQKHQGDLRAKMKTMRFLRDKMLVNLSNDTFDIESSSREIANIQQELEKMAFGHFRELRSVCREDQHDEFDQFVKKIWARGSRHKRKK